MVVYTFLVSTRQVFLHQCCFLVEIIDCWNGDSQILHNCFAQGMHEVILLRGHLTVRGGDIGRDVMVRSSAGYSGRQTHRQVWWVAWSSGSGICWSNRMAKRQCHNGISSCLHSSSVPRGGTLVFLMNSARIFFTCPKWRAFPTLMRCSFPDDGKWLS